MDGRLRTGRVRSPPLGRAEKWSGLKEATDHSKRPMCRTPVALPVFKDGINFVPAASFVKSVPGWVFKRGKKEDGTIGDHRVVPHTAAATKVLRVIVSIACRITHKACDWQHVQAPPTPAPGKRARRARTPNGSRKVTVSRRQRAIRELPSSLSTPPDSHGDSCALVPEPFFDEVASVNDKRWWHKLGLWALETWNPNSWASAVDSCLARSAADVIFLQ